VEVVVAAEILITETIIQVLEAEAQVDLERLLFQEAQQEFIP
jgi:hypothetical protein